MQTLQEILATQDLPVDLEFTCHDCRCPVRVTYSADEIGGRLDPCDGAMGYYPTLNDSKKEFFVKCADCYASQPELRNFNPIEVYTRVIGYYRPVSSFNRGKKKEYSQRVNYNSRGIDTK